MSQIHSRPTAVKYNFCFTFLCVFYQAKLIILEKTLNQNKIDFCLTLAHDGIRSRVLHLATRSIRCAMQYFTLSCPSYKTIYTMFDGFSTPVISFWLICTTRRWDRGSVWGHTLFLSELIFFSIHAKPHFLVARDQASIPGVNRVLSPKKLWMFFVCQQKFSEKHNFFFDRLKQLLVVQFWKSLFIKKMQNIYV